MILVGGVAATIPLKPGETLVPLPECTLCTFDEMTGLKIADWKVSLFHIQIPHIDRETNKMGARRDGGVRPAVPHAISTHKLTRRPMQRTHRAREARVRERRWREMTLARERDAHAPTLAHTAPTTGPTAQGHTGAVLTTCLSPDSKTVISGGSDNFVRVWSVADGTQTVRECKPVCVSVCPCIVL